MTRALLLLAVALAVLSSLAEYAAHASPCRDDHWAPTYVHDLTTKDGVPYYVMPDGSFAAVAVPYEVSGPTFCEKYGVRDRAGFTTCRDYTRVQCGCDADSRGNSTCARFLDWRAHAVKPAAALTRQYDTNFGLMTLHFDGAKVTGDYPFKDGRIDGVLSGTTLTGTWTQSNTAGELSATFAPDFGRIDIRWKRTGETSWKGDWQGTLRR